MKQQKKPQKTLAKQSNYENGTKMKNMIGESCLNLGSQETLQPEIKHKHFIWEMIPTTLIGGWKAGEEGAGSQEGYTIKPGLPGNQSLVEPPGVSLEQAPQSYHSLEGRKLGCLSFHIHLLQTEGCRRALGISSLYSEPPRFGQRGL